MIQALAFDNNFPIEKINRYHSEGNDKVNEPVNAIFFISAIVFLFVTMGSVDSLTRLLHTELPEFFQVYNQIRVAYPHLKMYLQE